MPKNEVKDPRDFDSLSVLPGGLVNYLMVIERVLRDLTNHTQPKIKDVERALTGESQPADIQIAPRSMESYVQNLQRIGLFVRQGNSLTVLPLAQRFLQAADPQEQARIIAEYLLRHCKGLAEVLVCYAKSPRPVTLWDIQTTVSLSNPTWREPTPYKVRSQWLMALGCIVKTGNRHSEITAFGRWCLDNYAPQVKDKEFVETTDEGADLSQTEAIDQSEDLIDELQSAGVDSRDSARLERAVMACLEFLTFETRHLAQAGRSVPDLLVRALLPAESLYTVIFDTKARATGHLEDLDVTTILDYMEQQNAEYAVVVAASFADGKIARQAEKHGIILLTIGALCDWVRLHAATPLSLADYEAIFQTGGVVDTLPESVQKLADQQPRWGELMALLLYYLQNSQRKQLGSLTAKHIEVLLFARLDEKRFAEPEIQRLLDFLSNPLVGCITQSAEGKVSLQMNEATLMRRLRMLNDHFVNHLSQLRKGASVG